MNQLISPKKVQPSGPADARILFVGEAPGYEEDEAGIPFVGDAGVMFNHLIGTINLSREQVRVTNICNHRPNNNKFDLLIGTGYLVRGVEEVKDFIGGNRPEWVVVLGGKPLEYLLGKKGKKNGIESWRGSVIEKDGINYFCSLHPAAALHQGTNYPIIKYDFQRLGRYIQDSYTPPPHDFVIDPRGIELEECLREIETCTSVATDIEGVKGTSHIRCMGFAINHKRAICLVNHSYNGMDVVFETSIRRILENPNIEKVFQNGFGYDIIVLGENSIEVANYGYDTMIGAHVLQPEMPYGLAFLTSIHTDEAYYKSMVRGSDSDDEDDKGSDAKVPIDVLCDYNLRDCICTSQAADKQRAELADDENLQATYDYKHSLIPLSLSLSLAGMEVDEQRRLILHSIVHKKWKWHQELLDTIAGFHVNVKSGIHMRKLLLEAYKLPERRDPKTKSITFDEDAIVSYLSLIQTKIDEYRTQDKKDEWELKLAACKCILVIRGLRQLDSGYINVEVAKRDGRLHGVYNIPAATETGRASAHKWIDGTGNNPQTWSRERFEIGEEEYTQIILKLEEKK